MPDEVCKFCGKPPHTFWRGQIMVFKCGSRPCTLKPESLDCLFGLVVKMQKRIEALEAAIRTRAPA